MSAECDKTFTAQVVVFLQKKKTLHFCGQVITFDVPRTQQELFAPLERVRNIVKHMLQLLPKYAPRNGWAQSFVAFRFPNGGGSRGDERPQLRKIFCNPAQRLAEQARVIDVPGAVSEWKKLVIVAERHHQQGKDAREAWACATRAYPEYKLARELTNLFLSCLHSTGDTERSLKDVALHHCAQRSTMGMETVEDTVMVAVHGPSVDAIACRQLLQDGSTALIPIGRFLPKVMEAYTQKFGHKAFRKEPRPRRDIGSTQDLEKRKKRRLERGHPQPEAEFLREQQAAIHDLMLHTR